MSVVLIPGGIGFFVQILLQLFLGLVVEFFVFIGGLASLLPELVSPPDNIHLLGCGHAVLRFSVVGGRGEVSHHSCELRHQPPAPL